MRCLMPAMGWYEWNEHEQTRSKSGHFTLAPVERRDSLSTLADEVSIVRAGSGTMCHLLLEGLLVVGPLPIGIPTC